MSWFLNLVSTFFDCLLVIVFTRIALILTNPPFCHSERSEESLLAKGRLVGWFGVLVDCSLLTVLTRIARIFTNTFS